MHTESEIQFEGVLALTKLPDEALLNHVSITVPAALTNKYDGLLYIYGVTFTRVEDYPHPTGWEYQKFDTLLAS
ncbi:hypothetical protein IM792_21105 [Mucilaginibacter sp. JRF]|uniref:hypothetical protein n=1 Tax=Mucilaginibacter sp. JRF TaxID=2780088 RepID=UPI0018808CFD|nr:hypothetical protein [Mucilaginibacter sp. JRF]MBE9586960.1 hypothetical protein [Mucilaginibacter sp. JRF]